MSRRFVALLAAAGLLMAALASGPGVALAGDPCFHAFDKRPAPSTGSTSQIVLGDCVFTPTLSRVASGTTVTWRNASNQSHEVVGSNMTWGAHDKLLGQGDTIGWTFETPGVFAYSCMIHPGMSGVIVVGESLDSAVAPVPVTETATATAAESADAGASASAVGLAAGAGGLAVGLFLARLRRNEGAPPA